VLVPRPDTETLVDWALELAAGGRRVIDLGTGSGAIALAIKRHRPHAVVEAVDASADALEVAAANARALELDVQFRQASWLEGSTSRYDLIVANPPYVAAGDPHLAALRHEPVRALEAGPDGLADIRDIVAQASSRLHPGGWLLLEHGWDQAPAVRGLLGAAGFCQVAGRRDLAGIERCSGGKWPELG
jgi:release factor glutamine methyltransferase